MQIRGWARTASILMALVFTLTATPLLAQRKGAQSDAIAELKNGRKDVKPKQTSAGTKLLSKAYDLFQAEKYDEAIVELDKLLSGKPTPYETSKAYQFKANIMYYQDRYPEAIAAAREAIKADGLNNKEHLEAYQLLAQLTANLEDAPPADQIKAFQDYVDVAPTVKGDLYAMMANVYYNSDQWDLAAASIDKALATGDKPSDSWYQIKVNALYQSERYDDAVSFLKELLTKQPKNSQFNNLLVSSLLQKEDYQGALAHLLKMKADSLFDSPLLWTQLYQLHLNLEDPLASAAVIEEGVAVGGLPATAAVYVDLGENYFLAMDNQPESAAAKRAEYSAKALEAFTQAASLSPDNGTADLWRCQLMLDMERAAESAAACELALKKGSLREEGNAHYLHGVALFNLGKIAEARKALQKAQGFPGSKTNAETMLRNLR